jgi:hypothetical protein
LETITSVDQAFRRAVGGQHLVPIWRNMEAWRDTELVNYQGIFWSGDPANAAEELADPLRRPLNITQPEAL